MVVVTWALDWWDWWLKTLKVLGILLIGILVAVKVFGLTISVPVSYEMVQEVIRADVEDYEGPYKKK